MGEWESVQKGSADFVGWRRKGGMKLQVVYSNDCNNVRKVQSREALVEGGGYPK